MGCKDCDHRHRLCWNDCPEYAEMKEKREALAKAKERERVGRLSTVGRDKSCEAHLKYLHRNKNRKEYR